MAKQKTILAVPVPSVGDIVHYVDKSGGHFPAIVYDTFQGCSMWVFGPTGQFQAEHKQWSGEFLPDTYHFTWEGELQNSGAADAVQSVGSKSINPVWLQKLIVVLESRKFWALVIAVGLAVSAYLHGDVSALEALQVSVTALVGYTASVAFEDGMLRRS